MVDLIKFQPYLEDIVINSPRRIGLRENYVSTFAELKAKVTDYSNKDDKKERKSYFVLEGLRKYALDQVLLFGKPGLGKSTALRKLESEQAKICLKEIAQNSNQISSIPILIELRSLKTSVVEKILEELKSYEIYLDQKSIKQLIRDRQLLTLLDGLNELPNSAAFKAVDEFRELCANFNAPLIISTRELGSTLIPGDIKKLEMSPLTESQMQDFIHRRLPETGDKLLQQLQGKLKELGETPLLLQMLCEVFSEKGEIPQNRGDLFRKEFKRRYQKFKPERLRNISEDSRHFTFDLLCYLAFRMVQGDSHVNPYQPTASWITISKTKAEAILTKFLFQEISPKTKAKEWLEDLLEWDLLQIASEPENIEFHHQLFQEYYAGEYLAPCLQNISDHELQQNYLNHLKWTESIAIAVSFIESEALALRITKLALDVDLKLGAKLAGSVKFEFQPKTVSMISQQQITDRFKVYLLGETKSFVVVDELIKMMDSQDEETRRVLVWASRKLTLDLALPIFNKAIKDSVSSVRDTAFRAIGEIDIEEAVNFAIKHLPQESDASVRQNVVVYILSKSESEATILQLLKSTQDTHGYVSEFASQILKQKNRQKVISLLIKLINNENNNLSLRISALEQLGELGDDSVISFLNKIILSSNKYFNLSKVAKLSSDEILRKINFSSIVEPKNPTKHILPKLAGEDELSKIISKLEDSNSDIYHTASRELLKLKTDLSNDFNISQDIINKLIKNLNQDKNSPSLIDTAFTIINLLNLKPSLNTNENLKIALYNASFNPNLSFLYLVIECLGKFSEEKIIERLLKFLTHPNSSISLSAIEAIKNMKIELIYQFLPEFNALNNKSEQCVGLDLILSIQSRCGFYNYEIADSIKINYDEDCVSILEHNDTTNKTTVQMNFYGSVENAVGNIEGDMNI